MDHPEVNDFVQSIINKVGHDFPSGISLSRDIQCKDLKRKMVYGDCFGDEYGIDNVQVILQGTPWLVDKDDYYKLESEHTLVNPDIPSGFYKPKLFATYRKARNLKDGLIKNVRIGVYPEVFRTKDVEIWVRKLYHENKQKKKDWKDILPESRVNMVIWAKD